MADARKESAAESHLVSMRGMVKVFPGVTALDRVDFDLDPGEVHVLLGENGAGKSTLMKVLAGVHSPDQGQIMLGAERISPRSVLEAQRLGIVMVMQEFNLIPDLTVAENLVLVNRPEGRLAGWIDKAGMEARAREVLDGLGLRISPDWPVRGLSVADKQMIEIAKAMSLEARALILDEPTAALSEVEVRRLFQIVAELKCKGVGIAYISHRFEEIFQVGDRVTVLRDGKRISSHRLSEVSADRLIRDMAGRELTDLYPRKRREPGRTALEARGVTTGGKVNDVSFALREGEILGVAGLVGAGRTELAKAMFGATPLLSGRISVFGKEVRPGSPSAAMRLGMALVTEDRKEEGLFMNMSMGWNISITDLGAVLSMGLVSVKKESRLARRFIESLRITPPDHSRRVSTLSGGTQQKVVLAKWLAIRPRILIMDEPTRGVDVGAKIEIYTLMDEFAAEGGAVLLISSDLPEIMAMSDRVMVMREGGKAGELLHAEFSQERVMALATGLAEN